MQNLENKPKQHTKSQISVINQGTYINLLSSLSNFSTILFSITFSVSQYEWTPSGKNDNWMQLHTWHWCYK